MERRSRARHFLLFLLSCSWKIFTHIPSQRRLQMRLSQLAWDSSYKQRQKLRSPSAGWGGRRKTFSQFSSPFCAPGFPGHASSKTCGISQNTDCKRDFENCYSQGVEGDHLHLSLLGVENSGFLLALCFCVPRP